MSNRILALTLAFVIVFTFVFAACGKKDKDNDESNVVSGSSVPNSDTVVSGTDDADDLTSSEFEKLESEFMENVQPEISIIPSKPDDSSSNASSSQDASSNESSSNVNSSEVDLTESGWIDGWF